MGLFDIFKRQKKTSYAYKKNRALQRKRDTLSSLRIDAEIKRLRSELALEDVRRENKHLDLQADKAGKMSDLLAEVENLKQQIGEQGNAHPFIQFANSDLGQAIVGKLLGGKVDASTPQSREHLERKVLELAEKRPDLVAKGMEMLKKKQAANKAQ